MKIKEWYKPDLSKTTERGGIITTQTDDFIEINHPAENPIDGYTTQYQRYFEQEEGATPCYVWLSRHTGHGAGCFWTEWE